MIDYRGKTYMGMLEEENEMLKQRWEKLKEKSMLSKNYTLLKLMEKMEEECDWQAYIWAKVKNACKIPEVVL